MRGLDTNVIVRFLVLDDKNQAGRVKKLFEEAERNGDRFLVATSVILEMLWVLTAVYDFTRSEALDALELISKMPILDFEDFDLVIQLVQLGRDTTADLSDLLIGLAGRAAGCSATLTFERGLDRSELFERI